MIIKVLISYKLIMEAQLLMKENFYLKLKPINLMKKQLRFIGNALHSRSKRKVVYGY